MQVSKILDGRLTS